MKKTMSNFLLGFLAGAAAGALMGVLLAPDKGSKTRQNIKKKVRELSDEYGLGLGEMMDEAGMDTETEVEEEEEPRGNPKIQKAKPGPKKPKATSVKKRKYIRKPKTEN